MHCKSAKGCRVMDCGPDFSPNLFGLVCVLSNFFVTLMSVKTRPTVNWHPLVMSVI